MYKKSETLWTFSSIWGDKLYILHNVFSFLCFRIYCSTWVILFSRILCFYSHGCNYGCIFKVVLQKCCFNTTSTCAHCLISLSCLSYLSVIYMELRHAIFIFILKTSLFEIILAVVSKRIWAEFGGRQLFPSMDVLMCLTTICRSDATSRKLFMCFWHLRSSLFIWWAKNTFKRVTMAVFWMWITWWLFFTRTWLQITQSTFECE